MHWIGMYIKLSPDNLDTILYNITMMADHDLALPQKRTTLLRIPVSCGVVGYEKTFVT